MRIGGASRADFRIRRTLALALVLLAIASSQASADAAGTSEILVGDDELSVRCTTSFSVDDLIFGRLLGYDTVRFADGDYLSETGRPLLPTATIRIALPAGMRVTGVGHIQTRTTELVGEYSVFPAQPPRAVSDEMPDDFVEPDAATYASTAAYPGRVVEFTRQADLAGQSIAFVRLYPVQYCPAERRLRLHTSITFTLEGVAGHRCGDYLPTHASQRHVSERWAEVRNLVVNPDDVVLRADDNAPMRTRGVEAGTYDYVIIVRPLWVADFQPLADWKTRKGVPAVVVDRSWIYGNYDGASDPEKIRAFVQDAAATWGASYFLLGGDTNTIPCHVRQIAGEDIPNDTYYADYDGDWVCEVHVGRASARGTSAIAEFISKVQSYEQDPPRDDYARTALMLGFDLYALGSNEGEGCKEDIRTLHIPADWTVRTEYDSEQGAHRSDSLAYLNQGHHLVNHIDHCGTNVMGVGSTNHGEHLYNGDMAGLHNAERLSILYTIGCWPCDYAADTCIGEAFVQNTNGGGIAFVGNSRSGWYNPYADNTLSLRYDRFFFRSLFLYDCHVLGACFSRHKNYALTDDELMRFIFTELTLLGDPELPIWTADPQSLTATHAPIVPPEPQLFSVYVYNDAGPVPDASVCLWKGEELYLVDATNESGSVFFTPAPETSGAMFVTVTKRNYVPYLGQADVGYVLNIDVVGDGHVDRLPDQLTYDYGDEVWLIATPDEGWAFDQWTGDAGGADPAVQITITANMSVTARFTEGVSDCPEDLTGDGRIDLADLAVLLGSYGSSGAEPEDGDLDGDGDVDLADLAQLLGTYGQDCPTH
jgi:hypothetical protein